MPARNVRDLDNIIARLHAIPAYVDQNIGLQDEAIDAGIMQPRGIANLVIGQIDAQLAQDAEHTELLKAFRGFAENIPRADQERLRHEALSAPRTPFRSARVVDTGIHELGWSREQALAYLEQDNPRNALAEVDRFISWPAQGLSYKLGELRIRERRAKAERELAAKFDIRDFNDAVIRDGRLPLDLLSEQIDRFIAPSR